MKMRRKINLNNEEVWYLIRDDNFNVLGRCYTLNEAVAIAEKKKRQYMRQYDKSKIWIEKEGETEEVYVVRGYEEEIVEFE